MKVKQYDVKRMDHFFHSVSVCLEYIRNIVYCVDYL